MAAKRVLMNVMVREGQAPPLQVRGVSQQCKRALHIHEPFFDFRFSALFSLFCFRFNRGGLGAVCPRAEARGLNGKA